MVKVPVSPFELNGVEFANSPAGGTLGADRTTVGVGDAPGVTSGLGRIASHQMPAKATTATTASTSGASRLLRGLKC